MIGSAPEGTRVRSAARRLVPVSLLSAFVLAATVHPAAAQEKITQARVQYLYRNYKGIDDNLYPRVQQRQNIVMDPPGCAEAIVEMHLAIVSASGSCAAAIAEGGVNVFADAACALSIATVGKKVAEVTQKCGSSSAKSSNRPSRRKAH